MGHCSTCSESKAIHDSIQRAEAVGSSVLAKIVSVALVPQNLNLTPSTSQNIQGDRRVPEVGKASHQLADFQELSDLGKGAFACVKKVACKKTGGVFAMKTVAKDSISKRGMEHQLHLEIETQQRLDHANIIHMHTHFEDQTFLYLVLEHAEGGSVFEHLQRRGRLMETEASQIFAQVTEALLYLHANGVAHRDVKAENVLFCSGHVAKLADFGWCAQFSEGQTSCAFCGTVDYVAPEIVVREPHDTRVDVWSTGVLLFLMLVGKLPFTADTLAEKFERIRKVQFSLPADLSPEACEVISGLLKRHPADRMLLDAAIHHDLIHDRGAGKCTVGLDSSTDVGESVASVSSGGWSTSVSNSDASQFVASAGTYATCDTCTTLRGAPEESFSKPAAASSFNVKLGLNLKKLDAMRGTDQPTLTQSRGMMPFTARGKLQTDPLANLHSWIQEQKAQGEYTGESHSKPALVELAHEIEARLRNSAAGALTSRSKPTETSRCAPIMPLSSRGKLETVADPIRSRRTNHFSDL